LKMLQYDFFPIPTTLSQKHHSEISNSCVLFYANAKCNTFVLIPKVDEISFTRTNIVRITKQCVYVITHYTLYSAFVKFGINSINKY
jgi:hypothetical protein